MKDFFIGLISNRVLVSAFAGWFLAQGGKVLLDMIKGRFTADRITGGGGMPSAHSATVCGLAVSALIVYGSGSFEFVMALFFAIIVMYDAVGVRRETGEQAKALNRLRERDLAEGRQALYSKPMQEHMGHTLGEIIAGAAVGIAAALIVCALIPEV